MNETHLCGTDHSAGEGREGRRRAINQQTALLQWMNKHRASVTLHTLLLFSSSLAPCSPRCVHGITDMIKGLIASELLFPDVVYFFGPRPNQQKYSTYPKRQKVRGKLRLVASRPIKLNRVELRLRGSTELNWRDPVKPQHSILAERMHAWRTLRKSKNVLLENATLPAGVTELGKLMNVSFSVHLHQVGTDTGQQVSKLQYPVIFALPSNPSIWVSNTAYLRGYSRMRRLLKRCTSSVDFVSKRLWCRRM